MSLAKTLWAELQQEAVATRKLLALFPMDQADYKPHPKSMSLKRLAAHVVEIHGWWKECLIQDELDFAKGDYTPREFASVEELLAWFDDLIQKAGQILSNASDEDFAKDWTMRSGDTIYFTQSKATVVRTWCLNHLYHHRAQLQVYLRLLNIPVPGMYGPSADDAS